MIQWNAITWYSKLGAFIVVFVVLPVLSFQFGRMYEQVRVLQNEFGEAEGVRENIERISIVDYTIGEYALEVSQSDGVHRIIPISKYDPVGGVDIVDVNFDGNDDVQVTYAAGAYNADTAFFIFSPKDGSFSPYHIFSQREGPVGYVTIDSKSRTAEAYFKGRGIGDLYSIDKYQFQGSEWKHIETETQDILPHISSSSTYYIKTVTTYENPGMETVRTTYFRRDMNDQEFKLVEVPEDEAVITQ